MFGPQEMAEREEVHNDGEWLGEVDWQSFWKTLDEVVDWWEKRRKMEKYMEEKVEEKREGTSIKQTHPFG